MHNRRKLLLNPLIEVLLLLQADTLVGYSEVVLLKVVLETSLALGGQTLLSLTWQRLTGKLS